MFWIRLEIPLLINSLKDEQVLSVLVKNDWKENLTEW